MNFRFILRYSVLSAFGLRSVPQFHSIMKGQEVGEHVAYKTKLLR